MVHKDLRYPLTARKFHSKKHNFTTDHHHRQRSVLIEHQISTFQPFIKNKLNFDSFPLSAHRAPLPNQESTNYRREIREVSKRVLMTV